MNVAAQAAADGLRPDPSRTIDEWADDFRMLSAKSSAEPGRWRTDRTPFLREIMRELSPQSAAEQVTFMKSAQIGGSELGNNFTGYVIDYAPGPMLIAQGTKPLTQKFAKQRIKPLIRDTPRIAKKVALGSRSTRQSMFEIEFPGGMLILTWASSAVNLRSMPIRYLFLDEVDSYKEDVDGEGDPVDLAIQRTATFARRKIYVCSTPTIAGRSRIESEYESSDQRKYFVPCPHCEHKQVLEWEQIKWHKKDPETAHYECVDCKGKIYDSHKTWMLENGEWIATNPEADASHVGFHINALYSPVGWKSWTDCVRQWLNAQGNIKKLKTFVNTVLGQCWKERGDAPEWERLYERRENYQLNLVPAGALILTAGVDVQGDRLELEIVGWGPGLETWSIDYRIIEGNTDGDEVWDALSKIVSETWPHESGAFLNLSRIAVDSGYATQRVYRWARFQPPERVMLVKGQESLQSLVGARNGVDIKVDGRRISSGGLGVWGAGVNVAKGELYGWLRLSGRYDADDSEIIYPPGFCHFPEYGPEYFKMLTAEQRVVKRVRGYVKYQWEQTRPRNEALDCRVYARVAASAPPLALDRLTPMHWNQIKEQLRISARSAVLEEEDGTITMNRSTNRRGRRRRKSDFWKE